MAKCEHQKHPVITIAIYSVTGLALFLHILSHLLPILLMFHSTLLVSFLESPYVTVAALLFIPLSIYHMWRDYNTHKTIHRLTEERDAARDKKSNRLGCIECITNPEICKVCSRYARLDFYSSVDSGKYATIFNEASNETFEGDEADRIIGLYSSNVPLKNKRIMKR